MPNNWSDHTQSSHQFATFVEDPVENQGNERFHGDELIPGVSSTIAMAVNHEPVDVDITAGQKMLSAMSGSLLTSLLGECSTVHFG